MCNNSEGFKASLKADNFQGETKVCPAKSETTLLTWELPAYADRGSITFQGNANYIGSAKNVKVTVKKATPKLAAKKKTFKNPMIMT